MPRCTAWLASRHDVLHYNPTHALAALLSVRLVSWNYLCDRTTLFVCAATTTGARGIRRTNPPTSAANRSGERATLAVLDVSGRLTPGVTVNFSNGDKLATDATGRALFVAPLTLGVLFASIAGRPGRVTTAVIPPSEAASPSLEIASVPRVASLTDRFELLGRGFCGDADSNQVSVSDHPALVLASSPVSLVVLPPMDLGPGPAAVNVFCANHQAPSFSVAFCRTRPRGGFVAAQGGRASGAHRARSRHHSENLARSPKSCAGKRGALRRQSDPAIEQRRRGKFRPLRRDRQEERQLPDFNTSRSILRAPAVTAAP